MRRMLAPLILSVLAILVVRVECPYCVRLDRIAGYQMVTDGTHPVYQWIVAAALRGIEQEAEVELVVPARGESMGARADCVVLRQVPERRPRYDIIGWGASCEEARKQYGLESYWPVRQWGLARSPGEVKP